MFLKRGSQKKMCETKKLQHFRKFLATQGCLFIIIIYVFDDSQKHRYMYMIKYFLCSEENIIILASLYTFF